jgi:hypothetical protein
MTSPETRNIRETPRSARSDLVDRYEQIGISAVAGALACEKAVRKKKEPAPVERRIKERDFQVTA